LKERTGLHRHCQKSIILAKSAAQCTAIYFVAKNCRNSTSSADVEYHRKFLPLDVMEERESKRRN